MITKGGRRLEERVGAPGYVDALVGNGIAEEEDEVSRGQPFFTRGVQVAGFLRLRPEVGMTSHGIELWTLGGGTADRQIHV